VPGGHDLMFIARGPMVQAGQSEVNAAVRLLLRRAKLIE